LLGWQAEGLALATLPKERAAFRPQIQISRRKPWVGDPHRDAFKFTLAHFPGNDGIQTDVVDYDESPGTPANRASGVST
jgi:hypothetical protein